MTTLQVFYTALKLNVTCKKGQKRPNVAVLVGNSADVAGGVRKASSGLRLMEVADAFPSICRSLHRVNEGIIGVNFGSPVAGIYHIHDRAQ